MSTRTNVPTCLHPFDNQRIHARPDKPFREGERGGKREDPNAGILELTNCCGRGQAAGKSHMTHPPFSAGRDQIR